MHDVPGVQVDHAPADVDEQGGQRGHDGGTRLVVHVVGSFLQELAQAALTQLLQ